jgi:alginate O-acetyltransferase complex protein AlgI
MLFNSYKFIIFFVVVVVSFFALPHRFRWLFLLAVSYFYYMCWDPKYALLILTTTIVVYGMAILMHGKPQRVKKLCVAASLIINLGILFIFKYFNFFSSSLKELFTLFGFSYNVPAFTLLLPVGISFYTFQALSYTIDVYRGTREPERHLGIFALYVSFFPVILSGPIERSTTLMPQFYKEMAPDYSRMADGLKLIAWGAFQKLVIADRLTTYVNQVYGNPQAVTGLPLLFGTYIFVLQVYCDFAGYTDIAIGSAQVLGFKLIPNFRRPFFAQTLGEFWRRWHISLISWFRDYLYIPLGGNRVLPIRFYFNMMLVFSLSGLWHGAQWTFVIWGAMNGVILIISRMSEKLRNAVRETLFSGIAKIPAAAYFVLCVLAAALALFGKPTGVATGDGARISASAFAVFALVLGGLRVKGVPYVRFVLVVKKLMMILITFHLFILGAVFFRARSVADALYVITHFPGTNFGQLMMSYDVVQFLLMILLVVFLLVIHYIQETRGSIRELLKQRPAWIRWALYFFLCSSILLFGVRGSQQFVYFQF